MNWTRLARTVAPDSAPLDIDDVKSHLGIAHSDDDGLIATLIDVATAYIDGPHGAGIALLTQTCRLSLDSLPRYTDLPLGPVQSVVSITMDGQTVSPSSYYVDADRSPALLVSDAPSYVLKPGSVKITYVAGYGEASDIPADLLQVIRLLVGHLYANREATSQIEVKTVPLAVDSILNRYRVHAS